MRNHYHKVSERKKKIKNKKSNKNKIQINK